LLELFSGYVQWEVVRVHDTLNEVEITGHQVLELLCDENATDVKLQCIALSVVVLIQVISSGLWNIENRLELDLTLGREVRVRKRFLVILGNSFIEVVVLALLNLVFASHPNSLDLIDQLPIPHSLVDSLGLLFFLLWFITWLLLAFIFDLGVTIILLLGIFTIFFFLVLLIIDFHRLAHIF
jgi:hypothetical protein